MKFRTKQRIVEAYQRRTDPPPPGMYPDYLFDTDFKQWDRVGIDDWIVIDDHTITKCSNETFLERFERCHDTK